MSVAVAGVAGLAVGALAVVGKAAYGMHQNSVAGDIEAANKRPVMGVNGLYQDNVDQAQIMSKTGIPTQEYNIGQQNIQRNLNGGLSALTGGSNPAGVISLVRAANDASGNLDAQAAEQRNRNLMNLMQQRAVLAQQQQKAFEYNEVDKYSENLAKSQALRGAGTQNIKSAADDAQQLGTSAIGMYGGAGGGNSMAGASKLSGYVDTPVTSNGYRTNYNV